MRHKNQLRDLIASFLLMNISMTLLFLLFTSLGSEAVRALWFGFSVSSFLLSVYLFFRALWEAD